MWPDDAVTVSPLRIALPVDTDLMLWAINPDGQADQRVYCATASVHSGAALNACIAHQQSASTGTAVSVTLHALIDRVIVPALLDRLIAEHHQTSSLDGPGCRSV
jgi:hypothetical protein